MHSTSFHQCAPNPRCVLDSSLPFTSAFDPSGSRGLLLIKTSLGSHSSPPQGCHHGKAPSSLQDPTAAPKAKESLPPSALPSLLLPCCFSAKSSQLLSIPTQVRLFNVNQLSLARCLISSSSFHDVQNRISVRSHGPQGPRSSIPCRLSQSLTLAPWYFWRKLSQAWALSALWPPDVCRAPCLSSVRFCSDGLTTETSLCPG